MDAQVLPSGLSYHDKSGDLSGTRITFQGSERRLSNGEHSLECSDFAISELRKESNSGKRIGAPQRNRLCVSPNKSQREYQEESPEDERARKQSICEAPNRFENSGSRGSSPFRIKLIKSRDNSETRGHNPTHTNQQNFDNQDIIIPTKQNTFNRTQGKSFMMEQRVVNERFDQMSREKREKGSIKALDEVSNFMVCADVSPENRRSRSCQRGFSVPKEREEGTIESNRKPRPVIMTKIISTKPNANFSGAIKLDPSATLDTSLPTIESHRTPQKNLQTPNPKMRTMTPGKSNLQQPFESVLDSLFTQKPVVKLNSGSCSPAKPSTYFQRKAKPVLLAPINMDIISKERSMLQTPQKNAELCQLPIGCGTTARTDITVLPPAADKKAGFKRKKYLKSLLPQVDVPNECQIMLSDKTKSTFHSKPLGNDHSRVVLRHIPREESRKNILEELSDGQEELDDEEENNDDNNNDFEQDIREPEEGEEEAIEEEEGRYGRRKPRFSLAEDPMDNSFNLYTTEKDGVAKDQQEVNSIDNTTRRSTLKDPKIETSHFKRNSAISTLGELSVISGGDRRGSKYNKLNIFTSTENDKTNSDIDFIFDEDERNLKDPSKTVKRKSFLNSESETVREEDEIPLENSLPGPSNLT